jgi:hypothetical protein
VTNVRYSADTIPENSRKSRSAECTIFWKLQNADKVYMLHERALDVVQQKREYDYEGVK